MWPGCRQHDQGAARGTVLDSAGLRVCFSRRNGVCYSRYCSVTTLSHFVCYSRYHHTATLCLQLLVQPHFVCYCRYHIATLCLLLRVSHCHTVSVIAGITLPHCVCYCGYHTVSLAHWISHSLSLGQCVYCFLITGVLCHPLIFYSLTIW